MCGGLVNDFSQMGDYVGVECPSGADCATCPGCPRQVRQLDEAARAGRLGLWEYDAALERIILGPGMPLVLDLPSDAKSLDLDDFAALIHPADRSHVMAELGVALRGEAPRFEASFRILRGGAEPRHVAFSGAPALGSHGVLALSGTCTDMDGRVRAETVLREASSAAERAEKARDDFLANASHELRTPLHGIVGMLQMAHSADSLDETRELLGLAQQAARQMQQVVGSLLDLAQAQAKPPSGQCIEFSPASLLSELARGVAERCKAKGLSFDVRLDESLPPVIAGDAHGIDRIVRQLLENAERFTLEGGVRLDVSMHGNNGGEIANLLVVVSDTGPGIAPERVEQVFEPFVLGEDVMTKSGSGMGLGLSLARRLAENMGGRLWCESTPGEGSTFFLLAPARRASCGV